MLTCSLCPGFPYVYVLACNYWFPPLHFRSSVTVSTCSVSKIRKPKNYVYPYKYSVAYVKNNVLRFCKFVVSVQIKSSSIFSVPIRQRQRRYGTAVRTRLRKRFTETDTDERKRIPVTRHVNRITVDNFWSAVMYEHRRQNVFESGGGGHVQRKRQIFLVITPAFLAIKVQ